MDLMTVYLICASVGVIFLVLSLVFGGDHDVGTHMDHHSMGDGHGGDSINLFSVRSITAFLATLGAIGALCLYYGMGNTPSLLVGAGAGLLMAFVAAKTMQMAMKQQISSTLSISDFVGVVGTVTTPIPAEGVGEVEVVLGGQRKHFTASSQDRTPIGQNASVTVISAAGGNLVVKL